MNMTIDVILLGLVLVVIGLFLKKWEPPIKGQYIFIALAISGSTLGYFMLNGFYGVLWGFVYTGLVFYKDELVKEASLVKDSFNNLKKETDVKEQNENEHKKEDII